MGTRDKSTGLILVNETRFPGGLKPWVDRVHSLGLKAGIYLDAGPSQCCSRNMPGANDGSLGKEKLDAQWLTGLGFDLLKYDDCGNEGQSYPAMRDALNATGRQVVYSVHGPLGGAAVKLSNSWRSTHDITNTWASIMGNLHLNQQYHALAAPGSWPQADMIEALQPNVTWNESTAHMVLWAAVKSPLLLGFDVRGVTSEQAAMLSNPRLLAVSRDPLAESATVVANASSSASHPASSTSSSPLAPTYPEWEVWAARMDEQASGHGGVAIPLHLGDGPAPVDVPVKFDAISWLGEFACARVVDLWTGEVLDESARGGWTAEGLAPHSATPVLLSRVTC